ncbi:uncharacterized protein TNCV_1340221 [Trichonephila clavipes]|uniref:Transposase Tc1-like domain-containing protein n=1 Tax=Trichonephila clavipes TaxID=2585209 RepID=A0A8X6UVG9_TRICX|nr:uncharacterized protein TNCV_1340221 [Trichonephila clavipes]
MTVRNHAATSRTIAQEIQCITYHSAFACTIQRHLQQSGKSARRPMLRLPSTGSHKRLRHQWCGKRRTSTTGWNTIVCTDESRFCLLHHNGRIRMWRHRDERLQNCCIMHRHFGPAPVIMIWDVIGFHGHTLLLRIAVTLNS